LTEGETALFLGRVEGVGDLMSLSALSDLTVLCADGGLGTGILGLLLVSSPLLTTESFLKELPEMAGEGKLPIFGGVGDMPPRGGDLINPPIDTWCLWTGGLETGVAEVDLFCFAFAISAIQAGCCGAGDITFGFGESGLFSALSSQEALVGLHLRLSMVFEGLTGGVASASVSLAMIVSLSFITGDISDRFAGLEGFAKSLVVAAVIELLIELALPGLSILWTTVALLWLDVGRDGEVSRLALAE
jgi:hypothetical protein